MQHVEACRYFLYKTLSKQCFLLADKAAAFPDQRHLSGPKYCSGEMDSTSCPSKLETIFFF